MSLTSCSIEGGEELWIIGKNFLKDTEVVFKEDRENSIRPVWMEKVKPIKEFFSNNHLIVNVPPYRDPNSLDAVVVNIRVIYYMIRESSFKIGFFKNPLETMIFEVF